MKIMIWRWIKSIIKTKDIDKFFNKKGLVYKELNLKDKIDNEVLKLIYQVYLQVMEN